MFLYNYSTNVVGKIQFLHTEQQQPTAVSFRSTTHQYMTQSPASLSPQASRDLVCFLQLDHVNVYYGQDYRSKYKAPTDYCLALKVNPCNCMVKRCVVLIGLQITAGLNVPPET